MHNERSERGKENVIVRIKSPSCRYYNNISQSSITPSRPLKKMQIRAKKAAQELFYVPIHIVVSRTSMHLYPAHAVKTNAHRLYAISPVEKRVPLPTLSFSLALTLCARQDRLPT